MTDEYLNNMIQMGLSAAKSVVGAVGANGQYIQSSVDYLQRADAAAYETEKAYTKRAPQGIVQTSLSSLYWGTVEMVDLGGVKVDGLQNSLRGICQVWVDDIGVCYPMVLTRSSSVKLRKKSVPAGSPGSTVENSETGRKYLPQVGDLVVVAFVNNQIQNAVILGIFPNKGYDGLFLNKDGEEEPNREISVHPTYFWTKVTGKDGAKGDYEMRLPDGTFISMREDAGTAVWPDTPPSPDDDLSEHRYPRDEDGVEAPEPEKTLTISHPSGSWARIKADGTVEVKAVTDLHIKADNNIKLDAVNRIDLLADVINISAQTGAEIDVKNISGVTVTEHQVRLFVDGVDNLVLTSGLGTSVANMQLDGILDVDGLTTLNGGLVVNGTSDLNGVVTVSGGHLFVNGGALDLNTHTHGGGTTGPGSTTGPV